MRSKSFSSSQDCGFTGESRFRHLELRGSGGEASLWHRWLPWSTKCATMHINRWGCKQCLEKMHNLRSSWVDTSQFPYLMVPHPHFSGENQSSLCLKAKSDRHSLPINFYVKHLKNAIKNLAMCIRTWLLPKSLIWVYFSFPSLVSFPFHT